MWRWITANSRKDLNYGFVPLTKSSFTGIRWWQTPEHLLKPQFLRAGGFVFQLLQRQREMGAQKVDIYVLN